MRRKRVPARLVSVSTLFECREIVALDAMAAALRVDRGRLLRCALGVLVRLGPDGVQKLSEGGSVAFPDASPLLAWSPS